MEKESISIAVPKRDPLREEARLLAADVGGTKCVLALISVKDGKSHIEREETYASNKFNSFNDVLRDFIGQGAVPERLSIAFAGPVQEGHAYAPNLGWTIGVEQIRQDLKIAEVFLINDLEGEAYGLNILNQGALRLIYPGSSPFLGNAGIIAPGTGLGEAGLFWDGKALHPFATEGGHTDFAPRNPLDWELLLYLQKQYGHVSWERVLSGPGICHIFSFLREVKKRVVPDALLEQMEAGDMAAVISAAAADGQPVCVETIHMFMRYLAVESSNLALTLNATGGIYLGGGILHKIWNSALQKIFVDHFIQVGRLRPLIETVPVFLVLNPKAVLLGAAHYGLGA